jgi:2-dehydropantoate 2-reductase
MNILVMGAGAIGSVFGGFLAKAGHEVSLVGRQKHMDGIAHHGLEIGGIWGEHKVSNLQTFTSAEQVTPQHFDLILITTKSYDTEVATKEILKLVGADSLVVSLQNGLGNVETISGIVGTHRAVAGRVIFGVELVRAGRVEITVYADKVMLGSPTGKVGFNCLRQLASTLTESGIPTEATSEINKYIWDKALYNCCLNALSTLLNCTYGELGDWPETRDIMKSIIAEVFLIAGHLGVQLTCQSPQEYEELLFNRLIPDTYGHHSSMLQDVSRGKKTEIDFLNGAIAKLAQVENMDAPVNWVLTQLIKSRGHQRWIS